MSRWGNGCSTPILTYSPLSAQFSSLSQASKRVAPRSAANSIFVFSSQHFNKSLTRHDAHPRRGRRGHGIVPPRAERGDELASDKPGPADDHHLH